MPRPYNMGRTLGHSSGSVDCSQVPVMKLLVASSSSSGSYDTSYSGWLVYRVKKLRSVNATVNERKTRFCEQFALLSRIFAARCSIVQSAVLRLHVVRPSVTLVNKDHIGWQSWKLTARTISPTNSLFVAKRPSTYSQGNMGKF